MQKRRAGGRGGQSSWNRGAMGGPSCRRGEQEAKGGSPHGTGGPWEVPHAEEESRRQRGAVLMAQAGQGRSLMEKNPGAGGTG